MNDTNILLSSNLSFISKSCVIITCLCHLPRAPMVVAATCRGARLCLLTLVPLALRRQLLLLHRADHSNS